ncbi:alpha/beta fold hydrolase [Paraburkholderia sp. C35]|uniref:alpha/beta fold hydrolase n=1 Tax=Paraburkholderia sp. C35 TaxID=2126993 RepID=UPI000D68AF56|nr:alpha/beta fold hydrolase [Paraburkholderia sp. C35]
MISFSARHLLLAATGTALAIAHASANAAPSKQDAPVAHVADQAIAVSTPDGEATLPLYADRDIDAAQSGLTRVFIIVHGTLRNADTYFATGQRVLAAAGSHGTDSMIVAPQFLTPPDLRAFALPPRTLVWSEGGWKEGAPARRPAPVSSFSALDALLQHFDDRQRYPSLQSVTLIGHSAGAQVVQRYAVAGRAEQALTRDGIHVRYVVANPSSYLYFDDARPASGGGFQNVDTQACPRAVQWKYGMTDAPAYVATQNIAAMETQYAQRDVVYLLGQDDVDPRTHFIDRSCAAMAQGPFRLARGLSYFAYLQARFPGGLNQRVVEVPGVGHDARRMLTSDCGMAVLFGRPMPSSCPVESEPPPK